MVQVTMATASGEEHGLINTVANSVQDNGFKHMDPETKAKCEKLRKEEARKVKARYINHRGKHERLTKPYCRWAGDPIQIWHFIPGHEYEVPKGLVDEVNAKRLPDRAGLIERNGNKVREDGSALSKDGEGEQIHEFVAVGF